MSTQRNIRAYLNSKDIAATMTGYCNSNRWGAKSDMLSDGLCFTANTAGSTVKLTKNGNPTSVNLEINTGYGRSNYTIGDTITLTNIGDKVFFRNTSSITTRFSTGTSDYYKFVMTGSIDGSGDVNSLLNRKSTNTLSDYCFYYLFQSCSSLRSFTELPATTLAPYCYGSMFQNCSGLTSAPVLPATTLASYCYNRMFWQCPFATAPVLPAATLAPYCYSYMFYKCSNLTNAPVLPATTLAPYCYSSMFYQCTSLVTPPALPATTLAEACYYQLFYGCTSLSTAPALPATTIAKQCYYFMFYQCTSLVTPPALPATTVAEGCYQAMFGKCTNLTSIAALPATTLVESCYRAMFNECSKIKISSSRTGEYVNEYRIPTSGTGTTANVALSYMFSNTGGTFTSNPSINIIYYTSNTIVS